MIQLLKEVNPCGTNQGLPPSNLIHQNAIDFFTAQAQIPHGDRRTRMIEPLSQKLEANSILNPLHIAEGFSQCMRPVIAVQVDR